MTIPEAAVTHRSVAVGPLRFHVAEAGPADGPVVVLCHGFPEFWYSWRAQIAALAGAGYRVLAPDQRGYGTSAAPAAVDAYTLLHLVGDLVGILDACGVATAAVVGHDWGAPVAWTAARLRPDRFTAVVGISVPYEPRGARPPMAALRAAGRGAFYQVYFQEPGVAEADIGRDLPAFFRDSLWTLSGGPERVWDGMIGPEGFARSVAPPPGPLTWIDDAGIARYVDAFAGSGFAGPLNWYRNIDRNWELLAPFDGVAIRQPAMFLAGSRDAVVTWRAAAVAALPETVPGLVRRVVVEGAGHWVQQEAPEAVNAALLTFLDTTAG